ncbi:MAG TPA: S-adenosylhomocysteine deaminase, partial [Candidatus Altiarchaeales archaeon]|nr:S-adenosylhomocysteine deaminase [Candidatus Altiarchaeales archaeon]
MGTYLLSARYIIINAKKFIRDGAILVKDNIILDVGEKKLLKNKYGNQPCIDFKDSLIAPGFINTHTHAAMVAMRGLADDLPLKTWLENFIWPVELKLVTRDFIKKSLPLAIYEMLASGITTFVDMYF